METPRKPDSNLVWAILCTVLCCLPLGIVSIIYATKVDSLYSQGDYQGAQEASDKAKKFAIIGAIASAVVMVLYFLFLIAFGVSMM